MIVLAIDPGPTESAYVVYDSGWPMVLEHGKHSNEWLRDAIATGGPSETVCVDSLAVEMIASYGMPVGREVFDTCVWIGRFMETWRALPAARHPSLIYRKDVKMHLCGQTAKVNDAVIRQALIDKFGPTKRVAIGTRGQPGPLFGITGDVWQALAVAVTYAETRQKGAA